MQTFKQGFLNEKLKRIFQTVLRMGKVPEDCKGISIPILKQGTKQVNR